MDIIGTLYSHLYILTIWKLSSLYGIERFGITWNVFLMNEWLDNWFKFNRGKM